MLRSAPDSCPSGATATAAARRRLTRRSDFEGVYLAAVELLARRDYASAELRRKLEGRGFVPDLVAAVVTALTDERKLDDRRHARNFIDYHSGRGQGPIRIRRELRELGLPEEIIDEALAAGPDFRVLARDVRVRKFGPEPPEQWAEKARQARFLQYRGFSSDHIRSALGPDFDPDP